MIDIKKYINEIVSDALAKLNVQSNIIIEKSSNTNFGDYSTNIALSLSKQLKNSPLKIAEDIGNLLKIDKNIITEYSVTKPGFLNFFVVPMKSVKKHKHVAKNSEFSMNFMLDSC